MNEGAVLQEVVPREILQIVIEKKTPAIMTYLSKDKWHVAKVLLTSLANDGLSIESFHSEKKPPVINIRLYQPVGISFKHGYGKFVFDSTVIALKPSADPNQPQAGGTIVLAVPGRMEVIQRRSYFRVEVPDSLKVSVLLWHRTRKEAQSDVKDTKYQTHNYFQGRLVDISAGGLQVMIPSQVQANVVASQGTTFVQRPDFKKGQFVGVRFTPMPYETPLMFSCQIRNILPAADKSSMYIGLQIVGLEASPEGRKVLSRIVGIVERYFKISQSGAHQHDLQPITGTA